MGYVDQARGSGAPWAQHQPPPRHQIHQRAGEQGHAARLGAGFRQANNPRRQKLTSGTAPAVETVVRDDRCVLDTQGAGLAPRHGLPTPGLRPSLALVPPPRWRTGSPLLRAGKPRRSRPRTAALPDSKAALVAEQTLMVTFGVFIHNLTMAATIRSVQRHPPTCRALRAKEQTSGAHVSRPGKSQTPGNMAIPATC